MAYEYDHDCPFEAFITNLGKYNEGELVGEWVKFPTTSEELQKVFERIGIGSKDDFGNPYEEWFISDYDCYVDGLYEKLGEYENLDELNYLASKLDELDDHDYNHFQAAMQISDYTGSIKDVEFTCADTVFRAKAKNIREKGWRDIQEWIMGGSAESTDSENDRKEKSENADMLACIATLTNGKSYPLQNPKMEEGKTTPKKHFTEDSLLSAMERAGADEMPEEVERKGIGTSATRAATIEKLVRIGFVERKGNKKTKYLLPTHKGVALITVMPEQIQSPSMTAEWEQKLLDVEKGAFRDAEFMNEIEGMIAELVRTYKIIEDAEVLMHPVLEEIGVCPCCV